MPNHSLQHRFQSLLLSKLRLQLFLPLACVAGLCFGTSFGQQAPVSEAATTASPAARITAPVSESSLVTLHGNVPWLAQAKFDQGAVGTSTRLTHIRLVLTRSAAQEAALEAYLAELQQKASPNYHKWLTPEQFGHLYGPADADIEAISDWLESSGLSVDAVSPGRTNIEFSGSAAAVESAFHTEIHSFKANGEEFLSNVSDPQIPSALSPVVAGVAHLNTIKPKSQAVSGPLGRFDASTGKRQIISGPSAGPTPSLTYNNGSNYLFAVPADVATIYDTPNKTLNGNYKSGSTYDGRGVTIGLGGASAITTSYVTAYRSLFLGNTTAPTITNVDGVGENQDDIEAYLDAEVSGGLAPGAKIHLYVSSDLFSGIEKALSDNTVDIFSLSFGGCELGLTTSDNAMISGWWQQAATQGIAVTVSTGDSGAAGCDDPNDYYAYLDLQVNGLASTPYNIAVGGTDYYPLLTDFSKYVTEAPEDGTAGTAANYYRSALGYIPESTWNESTYPNTTIADNNWTDAPIAAGGGGKSNCAVNTTTSSAIGSCTSGYNKPAWQRGAGVPADGVRDLPDVSLLASNGFYGALWLICYPNSQQLCTPDANGNFSFGGVGGTSASAPSFAGMLALVQQKAGGRLGQAAAELYDLANGSHGSSIFHDVTVGNNSVLCDPDSPYGNCSSVASGYPFLTGYNTTSGYDLATGLGSVDVTSLVNYWGTATGSTATTVTVTPTSSAINNAQSLSVTIKVSGSPAPTGTVTLAGGGYTSAATALASGTATITVPAGKLAVGTDTLTASYSGNTVYSAATGTAKVTVGAAVAASVTPVSGTPQTSAYGTAFAKPLVVLVKDSAGDVVPNTTVTFSGAGLKFSSATATTGANGEASVTATPTALGALTVSATVTGVKTPATFTLTATKATLTVTATNQTINYNAAIPSPLPYTITGFVNGDTSKVVTGAPVLSTTATKGAQPGTFPIAVALGNLAATDYTFAPVNGTLTIKALGVTATPATTITIADATAGYAVYFTLNGTTPTTSSTKYTGPIAVGASETVKFIAVAPGYSPSAVTTVADTVTPAASVAVRIGSATPAVKKAPSSPTTTTISSSLDPSVLGEAVKFVASVKATYGVPSGTITFKNGGAVIGTATLSGGAASLSTNALGVGSHSITATYNGGAGYVSSVSAALDQVVKQ
jgi:hypothetical protein